MRKALGYICYLIMLAADGAAAYYTYYAYSQKISYDLGLPIFTPVFIVSYWFATFFGQLMHPIGHRPLIHQGFYTFLYWLSTILSFALIGFWVYLFIDRSLYVNFGVEVSGNATHGA